MKKHADHIGLTQLLQQARACTHCEPDLPSGARPLLQAHADAAVLVIGQAPGIRAHESGKPWDDASGQRLRDWLGLDERRFYDPRKVALLPMGFCYPGTSKAGDLPPRPQCAPLWHEALLAHLRQVRLTVLIGRHAISRYAPGPYASLTDAVRDYPALLPRRLVLPHPSPRNNRWLARNPWFLREVIPRLRERVGQVM